MTTRGLAIAFTLLVSHGVLAAAPTTPPEVRQLRLCRFFEKVHQAVVAGRFPTYVRVKDVGLQASFLLGGRVGLSGISVVEKGQETKHLAVYGGASFGSQVGLGPEFSTGIYFGRPGNTAQEVTPTTEWTGQECVLVGTHQSWAKKDTVYGGGWDVASSVGFGLGGTGRWILKTEKAIPTPMLQHLQEGQQLSKDVQVRQDQHLEEGQQLSKDVQVRQDPFVAEKLVRMECLRDMIVHELKQLNTERHAVDRKFKKPANR